MPHRRRSSGVVSWVSTSAGEAPGIGTMTSTMGTTICGSSSRGVRATAATPRPIEARTMTGVSFERRNGFAIRPASPRRGSVATDHLDRLAVAERPGGVDHAVRRGEPGADGDVIADRLAEGEPAELGPAGGGDEDAGEVAAGHDGGARHPDGGGRRRGGRDLQPGERPGAEPLRRADDAGAEAAAVGEGVAA